MRVRCFYPNKEDKIEFTREELEKLINDVYDEGREDGEKLASQKTVPIIYPTPANPYTPIWYNTPIYTDYTTIWCTNDDPAGRCVLERENYSALGG